MNQQSPLTFHVTNLFLLLVTTVLMQHSRLEAQDWMQFRGAGGAAASADADLPIKWDADANIKWKAELPGPCLLYTSPSPRDATLSRMPSSA